MSDELAPATLVRKSERLLAAEKWDDAIALLRSAASVVREHARLAWNLGWACLKVGALEEAIANLSRAVELNPADAISRFALAKAYSDASRDDEAEREYLRALALREGFLPRLGLGALYLRNRRFDEGEAVHREGIRLKASAKPHEAFASFLDDLGRTREAKQQRRAALRLRTIESKEK